MNYAIWICRIDTGRARKKMEGFFLRRNGPEALIEVSE
jgi:hypothetical protein